ncbi:MAG: YbhB/YbcL family Raf kinase inhibitor-like protein, partial [Planctomycetota bacterium]
NGTWKFSRFYASLDKEASSGEKGEKAEVPPGDVLKSVIAGVESGDFEKVAGALPEEDRKTTGPEEMKKHIEETRKRSGGHWLETLKRAPPLAEGEYPLVRIGLLFKYRTPSEKIEGAVEYLKEKGAWKIGDIDVDVQEIPPLRITTTAFEPGGTVPVKHTGEGENVSPALAWTGVPEGTKEFALICDDPDAPRPEPWVHWVVYKIPATTAGLPEGAKEGFVEGTNSWKKTGYGGPMPPKGHGVHHYHFKLYALDAELELKEGLTKKELLAAMKGHILAEAEMIGIYERK